MQNFRHFSTFGRPSHARFTACALAAVALIGGALSGCSNNPYPPGESDGNVLYRTLSDDPKSLDPSFSYTADEGAICDLIYPSFYKYDYLKRNPFVLQLNIGAKEPTIENYPVTVNGKTIQGQRYTFTIRKDLRFQDDPCFTGGKGRAITANDIVYSFKRMTDPAVQCPVASFFADKVVGWNEYGKAFEKDPKGNYDKPMPGVQVDASDPYTFHILLAKPYPQLRFLMAMHFTTPQAREAVATYGAEYPRHPVGCGMYYMSESKPKQRYSLSANPNRYKLSYPTEGTPEDKAAGLLDDAGKQLPLNDKVVFSVVKEGTSAWNLFLQGYLDSAGVSNTNYQQVVASNGLLTPEMEKKGIILKKDTLTTIRYGAFNMDDPTFGGYTPQKRKLRQAISLAFDEAEYADILLQGNAFKAEWLIPPSVFGNDPNYKNPYRDFDPKLTKAKQLLAEAGYPDGNDAKTGEKLVLHYDNAATNAAGRLATGILQRQIERLGIKVESRATTYPQFQEKLLKGQHQFITYGWIADYPDPENFVFLLYGPNRKPGPNSADYSNPAYDKLFEQMQVMPDGPERIAIIKKMRDIAVEDCPWIPMYHEVSLSLSYDWQKNVKSHPIANDLAQYRRIDIAKRTKAQREWNSPNYVPLVVLVVVLVGSAVPAVQVVRRRIGRRVRRDSGANVDPTTGTGGVA